jgi:hypothetical protein
MAPSVNSSCNQQELTPGTDDAGNRSLLIGVSDNEARINPESFTADQAGCNTGFNDILENPAEHTSLSRNRS